MNVNDIFSSKHLKATDLQGKPVRLTITSVELAEFDNGPKPVAAFQGTDKTLVLNRTNTTIIADALGGETNDWIGRQVELYPDRVPFQGKMVDAIRCRAVPNGNFQQNYQAPPPPQNSEPVVDDEVPF